MPCSSAFVRGGGPIGDELHRPPDSASASPARPWFQASHHRARVASRRSRHRLPRATARSPPTARRPHRDPSAPRAAVPQQQRRALRIVGGHEGQGVAVELTGRGSRAQPDRPVAGHDERRSSPRLQIDIDRTRGAAQVERLQPMMGGKLCVVLAPLDRQLLDPFRSCAMLPRALDPRDLPVGDVADQRMPERILGLVGNGAAPFPPDEALALERVEPTLDVTPLGPLATERADPEDLADHGGVLEQVFSAGGSPSRRAAMIPCSVSGIGSSASSASAEPPRFGRESRDRRACARTARRRAGCPRRGRGARAGALPATTAARAASR